MRPFFRLALALLTLLPSLPVLRLVRLLPMLILQILLASLPLLVSTPASAAPLTEPSDPLLLSPEDYRRQVLLPQRLGSAVQDSTLDQGMRLLLRAAGHFDGARHAEAYQDYSKALALVPELEGEIALRMARCLLAQGQLEQARGLLVSRAMASRTAPWIQEAQEVLFQVELAQAAADSGALSDSGLADPVWLHLAQGRQQPPRSTVRALAMRLSLQRWEQSFAQKTLPPAMALDSLVAWARQDSGVEASQFLPLFLRVMERHQDSLWSRLDSAGRLALVTAQCQQRGGELCLQLQDRLSREQSLAADVGRRFLSDRARILSDLGRHAEAVKAYDALLKGPGATSSLLRQRCRALGKAGQGSDRSRCEAELKRRFPYSAEVAGDLWVRAFEHEQQKRYPQALRTYDSLDHPRFGKNPRHEWARFRIGLVHYKQGRIDTALAQFRLASREADRLWPRSASLFFQALCLRNQWLADRKGDTTALVQTLVQTLLETIQDFPLGYYAHRARQILLADSLLPPARIPSLGQAVDSSAVMAWLAALPGKVALPEPLASQRSERLRQITLLRLAGFQRRATELEKEWPAAWRSSPEGLYLLGQMHTNAGEVAEAFRKSRAFLNQVERQRMAQAPVAVLRFLYPLPYQKEVLQQLSRLVAGDDSLSQARRNGQPDVLFVHALMRQESIFDEQIVSPVGARGLMQIMPATGLQLAAQENLASYHVDLLFNPGLATRLGTRYLWDLWAEYGHPAWVLANYNAGPGPARRWQKELGPLDWDLAAEEVSYWETRDYIKKVLGNWWTYQAIWQP